VRLKINNRIGDAMALTTEEKNKMLEMLASPVQGQAQQGARPPMFGMIKIETLVQYRDKSDEEILAELKVYSTRKQEALQKRRNDLAAALTTLDAQLASVKSVEPKEEELLPKDVPQG